MAKVLIDQWHVDIYSSQKLTRGEYIELRAIQEAPWLPDMLNSLFDPKLRKKLKIKVTK